MTPNIGVVDSKYLLQPSNEIICTHPHSRWARERLLNKTRQLLLYGLSQRISYEIYSTDPFFNIIRSKYNQS